MRTSETTDQIAGALASAQAEFPVIEKNRVNPHFKSHYADLYSILKACRPVLSKHGIAFIQGIGIHENKLRVTTRLAHKSGQWIEDDLMIKPERDSPQSIGSATTYARRYAAEGLLGISATDDDDGQEGEKKNPNPTYSGTEEDKKKLLAIFHMAGIKDGTLMKALEGKILGMPFGDIRDFIAKEKK